MPYDLSELLVVAISSSALFDCRREHEIFQTRSVEEYVAYQIAHENEPLEPGTAFPLIRAMLRLNRLSPDQRLVEVVVLSHMAPEAGLRVMNSIEHHELDITRAAFTGGEPVARYLQPYHVKLFLSRDEEDVKEALELGFAAGLLYDPPANGDAELDQLRIAFDGDAVIFSDESERVYQRDGLEAFQAHERQKALKPLPEGPFALFLRAIAKIQKNHMAQLVGVPPIRTALVTARGGPAHKRVILTLRAWEVKIDEMYFLGGVTKEQVLAKFRPHIFFDDQDAHGSPASKLVPSARVPVRKRTEEELDPEQGKLPFPKLT